MTAAQGQMIGGRYRLERCLGSESAGPQGALWLASDQLAADAPVALRCIGPDQDQARARELWSRLQGVLHPQVPRIGAVIEADDQLWLVREWQAGRTYQQLLELRAERQLVFGAGEVLLLLRQLLPVLAALHSQDLLHGDLSPANLLRRDSDGLPVPLDFGLVRGTASGTAGERLLGATPGYAPPELAKGEPAQPWMDLHALGVVALVLLSGDAPGGLLDPTTMQWRWPAALEAEPDLRLQLQRLLSRHPDERFASAGQALVAVQSLAMPDSTGPVPRADRTVILVPAAAPAPPPPPAPVVASEVAAAEAPRPPETPRVEPQLPLRLAVPPPPPAVVAAPDSLRRRYEEREEAAEGGFWPVLIALVLSAVVGTAVGWWWLSRGKVATPPPGGVPELPSSLPPSEVDQRQQLLNRLRAMQVDRAWFLSLVDAALLAQYPERNGRLPSDTLEDAPLRRVWNELAEEWLARVEQLPLPLRRRLGNFSATDWEARQAGFVRQGLSPAVLRELVSASVQNLLPSRASQAMPPEPFRQIWYAAGELTLENLRIEPIEAPSGATQVLTAEVPASGARLFPIRLPAGHGLALGVNGSPLLQMSVFSAEGTPLEARGPLRVVTLGSQKGSPVQLLLTNDGVAPALIRLSLRADPPAPTPPPALDSPPAPEETPETPDVPAPANPGAGQTPAGPAAPAPPPPVEPTNP
ncbi:MULTISPECIES: protein kinase domain-containing protein [unclassified Cyanobium]|uniref:serine/threonine protein kinase n=1 Tax=unclassified Cyanobium TaxID=2627006 RepID=UPI0020CF9285|nr:MULTISPECIES: serine/threonine protein kinase [unclassified Cyanobium]MCP9834467.1 serine/threonine protein kinase [Cyanobium sp. La Preciosa 7G6]MCP9937161.1 serine/threonine protein kinase [Cyanobium sp. Aljojuca 7A6]